MFVQEPLLGLLGREGLEFYSRHLTELDDFWLEDSKMMTDGTSAAKYENVEENTAKALRNARRNFSGDEQLFKNEKAKVCTSTDRNGLEFDPKHDAPSKVDLGQKYNEVYANCQEDVFTGWPGTLELETEKNRLNSDRLEFDSNMVTKNKQNALKALCFVSAESCKSKNCVDSKKVELKKKIKFMNIMDKILRSTRSSPPTPRTWRRRPQVLCGSVKKCAKQFGQTCGRLRDLQNYAIVGHAREQQRRVATSTATSAVTRARLLLLEYKKRECSRALGSVLWIVK